MRINKYLSDIGHCSRRKADQLVSDGKIMINGKLAELGSKVSDGDVVKVGGKVVSKENKPVYIALNKPKGIECTANPKVKNNIVGFVGHEERIYPVGRLDKDSEGLILLTNDGEFADKIMRAKNFHEKEYIVRVNKAFDAAFIKEMSKGVDLEGRMTRPCEVEVINERSFKIVLTQGMNRQIRRMTEALGYNVTELKRVRVMSIELGRLSVGKWRNLKPHEIERIMNRSL